MLPFLSAGYRNAKSLLSVVCVNGHALEVSPCGPQPRFSAGDRVLITEGAFTDLEAIFVSNEGDQRVSLLLNILQPVMCSAFRR